MLTQKKNGSFVANKVIFRYLKYYKGKREGRLHHCHVMIQDRLRQTIQSGNYTYPITLFRDVFWGIIYVEKFQGEVGADGISEFTAGRHRLLTHNSTLLFGSGC